MFYRLSGPHHSPDRHLEQRASPHTRRYSELPNHVPDQVIRNDRHILWAWMENGKPSRTRSSRQLRFKHTGDLAGMYMISRD